MVRKVLHPATRTIFFTKENENNHHLTLVPLSSLILLVSLAFIFFYTQLLNILIVKSPGQGSCNRVTDTKDFISGAADHFIFEKLM